MTRQRCACTLLGRTRLELGVERLHVVEAPERRRAWRSAPIGGGVLMLRAAGAEGRELEAHPAHPDPVGRRRPCGGAIAAGPERHLRRLDRGEVRPDGGEVGARRVRGQRVGTLQRVVGRARIELEVPAGVGGPLRRDPPPLLVHVVVARDKVLADRRRSATRRCCHGRRAALLPELPPAVAPLEGEAADGVADASLAARLLVDLLPLRRAGSAPAACWSSRISLAL